MSHSPHPWTYELRHGAWFIADADDDTIVLINKSKIVREKVDETTMLNREVDVPHAAHDAALIAAAPELLEALKAALVQIGEYVDGDSNAKFYAISAANAVILKATVPL